MKIFLSALEVKRGKKSLSRILVEQGIQMKYNLMSYYYLRKNLNDAYFIKENSQLVIIDSGAHSFQKGTKVDWVEYTKQYAEFIKEFDEDKVIGYFEMDVDNILGYEKVLELRKILESVSDKIIPV